MEIIAKTRYLRMSPQKVRLVVDVVRGLDLQEARRRLTLLNKAAALPVLKTLNSAAANAVHNFGLPEGGLRVKSITADGGPILYRFRPAAMGRSTPIRKRTAHLTVVLESAPARKSSQTNSKISGKASKSRASNPQSPTTKL